MALLGAGAVSFLVAGVVAAGPATADKGVSSGAPPGNNATVKINNIPFDDNVNNEPHVSCPFLVSFYNFDEQGASNTANVTFTAQPPSGNFQDVPVDAANSDGTNFTWDGSTVQKKYTFTQATLGTLTLQPQQGYHLKLTVDVTSTGGSHGNGNANSNNSNGNNRNGGNSGNNGNDHGKVTKKHKVFWLTCAPTDQPSSGTASSSAPASNPVVQPTQSQQQQPATQVSSSPAPKPSATVLGEKVTRKPVRKPPKAHVKAIKVTKLPFTGVSSAMLGVYVPAGLGFLFTGAGLIGLTRRTRMHSQV
jgi:hypothetical protein